MLRFQPCVGKNHSANINRWQGTNNMKFTYPVETNITCENQCLDDEISFRKGLISELLLLVSGRVLVPFLLDIDLLFNFHTFSWSFMHLDFRATVIPWLLKGSWNLKHQQKHKATPFLLSFCFFSVVTTFPTQTSHYKKRNPSTMTIYVASSLIFTKVGKAFHDHRYSLKILLMAEILHQLIGSLPHYLQGSIHPRWLAGILPSTVCFLTMIHYNPHMNGQCTQPERKQQQKTRNKYVSGP